MLKDCWITVAMRMRPALSLHAWLRTHHKLRRGLSREQEWYKRDGSNNITYVCLLLRLYSHTYTSYTCCLLGSYLRAMHQLMGAGERLNVLFEYMSPLCCLLYLYVVFVFSSFLHEE